MSKTDYPIGRRTILLWTNNMGGWSATQTDGLSILLKHLSGVMDHVWVTDKIVVSDVSRSLLNVTVGVFFQSMMTLMLLLCWWKRSWWPLTFSRKAGRASNSPTSAPYIPRPSPVPTMWRMSPTSCGPRSRRLVSSR